LPKVDPKYQAQLNMAAMILKAHEDKTKRGANIASLTVPWGGGENANENNIGGYHLVWSRDLYQVATAYMALGDREAANRALDFVFNVQQKPDGSFPQNSFLDGKPFWGSLQLDEVAFPLILAYQLKRFDKATYENHVRRAADFLVKNGPKTPQERWEEKSGYSPSTIAAEIAGLICAAEIARKNGDKASALVYTATADDWARKVDMWTATVNGRYGDGNYYVRLTENGKPDALEKTVLNNGAGTFIENEIVDAGFLELVRLGIKPADDPLVAKSLKVVDEVIRVNTPNGDAFYRYNHDGYGEMDDGRRWNFDGKYTGKGRLWALLSGERGQYELAVLGEILLKVFNDTIRQGNEKATSNKGSEKSKLINDYEQKVTARLNAILGFANEGLMIPEQIWDRKETPNADKQFVPELKFGENTGSATPLAWSMAQFIRLAVNLKAGRNLDTPDIVYERYRNGIPGQASNFGGMDETAILPVKAGEKFSFTRQAVKNTKVAASFQGVTKLVPVDENGKFSLDIVAPETEETGIIAIEMPDGATAFERVKVRAADKLEPPQFSAETIEKLKNAKTSPLIENGKAILFYRGAARNVMVAGDMTGWNPRIYMQKVGENLHAVALDLAPTARAEYKIVVDGKWLTDEANPNKLDNGVGGENSVLTMPGYKTSDWIKGEDVFLDNIDFRTEVFNGTRLMQVYNPGECVKTSCPALYFQDGSDYVKRAEAVHIQQNLVKARKIKPFIMVFLDPKDRMKEYWASDDYARFAATEVVPAIDAKYNTIKSRDGRGIIGASLGGITSIWVGLKYPEVFSRIGGQSSSFWVDNERVVKELSKLDANQTKFRFYLDDGSMEGTEDTRRVVVMLRAKGYPVTYRIGETGHNWTSWRDRLADAFVAFMN
jgi:GH15 family glucan-1,4-alpha-glucosidase/enterochelin esterase-like enzyme